MTSDTLKITTLNQSFNDDFNLLTKYLDHQVSEMTERQFNITHIMLKKQGSVTQGEIAELLGASRESINRTINSSKLNFVIEYSQLFSKKVKEIIL